MAGVEYVITCICKHGRQLLFLITDFLHKLSSANGNS